MTTNYARHVAALNFHCEVAPFMAEARRLNPEQFDDTIFTAVIEEAARFARDTLEPLGPLVDSIGCSMVDGRVITSEQHRNAWTAFVDAGWPTLSLPVSVGGQGLPLILQSACDDLWNRASPAFMMLANPGRASVVLLAEHAEAQLNEEWLAKLASGTWAATICISEPDAGSDLGRVRTLATQDDHGYWRINGEKCWISFGDHDLAPRIGHCLIARTSDSPGTRGLSLFLVPNVSVDGNSNGVHVRRIEEKLGLHGSPTCVLGFDEAIGTLVGSPEKGLQCLFTMVLLMRLSVGSQGAGVATGALESAMTYAVDRRQGGSPKEPPVALTAHADVQRQLLSMAGRVEAVRGLTLAAASAMDLAEITSDASQKAVLLDFIQWLLPIVKDFGGRTAFDVASDAIQVCGGAGYTREWPIERALRDAKVFAIFEGTSGMQAIDMVHRRIWRDEGRGLAFFLRQARADAASASAEVALLLTPTLDRLEAVSGTFAAWQANPKQADTGAVHYLNLSALAAAGWVTMRLIASACESPPSHVVAAARFFLAELGPRADLEANLAELGAARLGAFDQYAI